MTKNASDPLRNDPDRSKGAEEPDSPDQASNNSMSDQLGHRNAAAVREGKVQDGTDTRLSRTRVKS